jgi:hypothetical protein
MQNMLLLFSDRRKYTSGSVHLHWGLAVREEVACWHVGEVDTVKAQQLCRGGHVSACKEYTQSVANMATYAGSLKRWKNVLLDGSFPPQFMTAQRMSPESEAFLAAVTNARGTVMFSCEHMTIHGSPPKKTCVQQSKVNKGVYNSYHQRC